MSSIFFDAIIIDPTYIVNNQYYTIDEMKNEISKLEKENKIDTYEYKNIKFVYDKVKNIEKAKYYFSSKIIAGLIYTPFIIINGVYMLGALQFDFIGWDKPLELFKYYRTTPFNIRIIDYYIAGLGTSFIGVMLFSLVTMLMSLIVKNNMISLLLSLGMYYSPAFVGSFIPIDSIARIFSEINLAQAVRIVSMFKFTSTYNIFGNPVLYSTVLISLVVVSIPVVVYLIKYFGRKQAI